MNSAVNEFLGLLSSDAVGMVYYSGHGVQINSANYLIPTDIQVENVKESDLADDSINLGVLLDKVAQTQTKFVLAVIDACRDNPFQQSGGRSLGATRGLSPPVSNAQGIMVVYAAGANQQALDRLGKNDTDPNGLFTREFVRAMRQPGLTVQELVNSVKRSVIDKAKAAGHVQTPAIYDQSVGTFIFTGPTAVNFTTTQPVLPAVPSPPSAGFSLDDIAKQETEAKTKWTQWQAGMQAAFDQASAFEGRAEAKRAVWDRFLAAYAQKNPFSKDDDRIRSEAAARKAAIRDDVALVMPAPAPVAPTPQSVEHDMHISPATRRDVLTALLVLGFDPGQRDGDFGDKARRAISGYQQARRYAVSGYLDPGLVRHLIDEARTLVAHQLAEKEKAERDRKARESNEARRRAAENAPRPERQQNSGYVAGGSGTQCVLPSGSLVNMARESCRAQGGVFYR